MEITVTKHIRTFKDLPIIWKENRDCFQLSLRAIGGKQPTFKSKSEAVAFAKDAFTDWRDGSPIAIESDWSVDYACEKYIEMAKRRYEDNEDRYGPATLHAQTQQLAFMCDMKLGGLRLGKREVRHLDTDLMVERLWPQLKKGCSEITAMNYYVTFKQMMNYCVTRKQIKSNVARDATLKEAGDHRVILPSKKDRSLELLEEAICRVDPETILRIFQNVELQHRMKVMFAIETGLRAGEQVALKVYDKKTPKLGGVDFKNNVVRVRIAKKRGKLSSLDFIGGPKSKKGRRTVPLDPDFSKALKEYWMAMPVKMKTEGWLFPTEKGTLSDNNNWRNRILYPACDRAGLAKDERPTWHGLRHAYATAYLNKHGGDIIRAMELMGHADMSTTLMYKEHVEDPERDEADAKAVSGTYKLDLDMDGSDEPQGNVVPLRKAG
jgi:integrase